MITLTALVVGLFVCVSVFKGGTGVNNRRYGFGRILFDIAMTFFTSGLWLIWLFIKYVRTH